MNRGPLADEQPRSAFAPPSFPAHARAVVRSVRGAFCELLSSVGAGPDVPQDVSRRFGLNKNLAWKVCKIIQTDDPAVALEHMPGAAGIKIFLRSLERAGSSPELLQTARQAVQEYDRLIRVHAGDRATLEMMGGELSPVGRRQRDEYHRKLLFQGASYVWGVQCRAMLKIGLVGIGSQPGTLDFASLSALIDFRRLRPDVTWVMAMRESHNDDGSVMLSSPIEAMDPRFASPDQAPLLADFCSQPPPELRRIVDRTGTNFELVEGQVGNTGARTSVVGVIQRGIPYYRSAENEWGEHSAVCDTPAKLMLLDLFVHNSLTFAIPPEPVLVSRLPSGVPQPGRKRKRLPLHERLQDLGMGATPVATPEIRRYNQMIETMFARTGWDPADFHGFRMKIAYPACPTALLLRYRLPPAP
ncbi:MAG: hypothetical protein PVJ57_08650 [Phycisphaerae bacterium]|jgi:hypothetical protein